MYSTPHITLVQTRSREVNQMSSESYPYPSAVWMHRQRQTKWIDILFHTIIFALCCKKNCITELHDAAGHVNLLLCVQDLWFMSCRSLVKRTALQLEISCTAREAQRVFTKMIPLFNLKVPTSLLHQPIKREAPSLSAPERQVGISAAYAIMGHPRSQLITYCRPSYTKASQHVKKQKSTIQAKTSSVESKILSPLKEVMVMRCISWISSSENPHQKLASLMTKFTRRASCQWKTGSSTSHANRNLLMIVASLRSRKELYCLLYYFQVPSYNPSWYVWVTLTLQLLVPFSVLQTVVLCIDAFCELILRVGNV